MSSEDESSTSGGAPDCATVRTNGSSSKEECEDSSDESSDGSEERHSWGWDLLDEVGINPDKHEEVI